MFNYKGKKVNFPRKRVNQLSEGSHAFPDGGVNIFRTDEQVFKKTSLKRVNFFRKRHLVTNNYNNYNYN